jgi:hypothetical protein
MATPPAPHWRRLGRPIAAERTRAVVGKTEGCWRICVIELFTLVRVLKFDAAKMLKQMLGRSRD